MYTRYAVIRDYKEILRVDHVHHYTAELTPPRITFCGEDGVAIKIVPAEIGDVVQPIVIGFYSGLPPIDQSESRIRELTERFN